MARWADGTFLPNQEKNQATFISHQELKKHLGQDPKDLGFRKTRTVVHGKRKRGYWVKNNHPVT